jgi:hypothetical protein
LASDPYTAQQLADMARRLDECIEVSALCMNLALAGERRRRALADSREPVNSSATSAPHVGAGGVGQSKP